MSNEPNDMDISKPTISCSTQKKSQLLFGVGQCLNY